MIDTVGNIIFALPSFDIMLRPGSAEARQLFCKPVDVIEWNRLIMSYSSAIAILSKEKKKPELISLDQTVSNIPIEANKRHPKRLILKEVSQVMAWKLIRGKARPLQKLVDSNTEAVVQECSTIALQHLDQGDWKKAIDSLTVLKGIGPATASAILAPISGDCPFMADEVFHTPIHFHILSTTGIPTGD